MPPKLKPLVAPAQPRPSYPAYAWARAYRGRRYHLRAEPTLALRNSPPAAVCRVTIPEWWVHVRENPPLPEAVWPPCRRCAAVWNAGEAAYHDRPRA